MRKIICNIILYCLTFYLFVNQDINAQQFYRIKAEYTIKFPASKQKQILQKGAIFYDLNSKTLVIKNGFPRKELIAQQDSFMYKIQNNKVIEKYY